jgi:hypothetical protein
VGIDPGLSGAAVVLDDRSVVFVVSWKPAQRNRRRVVRFTVRDAQGGRESVLPRLSSVGRALVGECTRHGVTGALIAVEDTFMGRNVKSAVSIARGSGLVVGVVESIMDNSAAWVMAHEWRAVVLGMRRNADRATVKRASLTMIPARVAGLKEICGPVGEIDHVTDAAGIAEWLRVTTRATEPTTKGTKNQWERNE